MTTSMIPTKFLILSDTHNFIKENAPASCPLAQPMPKVDVVLHCGDLTNAGGLPNYSRVLQMLAELDAELKLIIPGNHDLSLDKEYWNRQRRINDDRDEHEKAVALMTGPEARAAGVTYLTEGTYEFNLKSGAKFRMFASPYTPEFCNFAFPYSRNENFYKNKIPQGMDIVMTHGPPRGLLDFGGLDQHIGCDSLLEAIEHARPLLHCFGHIHESHGMFVQTWGEAPRQGEGRKVRLSEAGTRQDVQDVVVVPGKSTLMINAAIMNVHGHPVNAPWLVELPLWA